MRSSTVIYVRWKISERVEIFVNLGKLYSRYSSDEIGVSRYTLNRKDLYEGWESDMVEIRKIQVV